MLSGSFDYVLPRLYLESCIVLELFNNNNDDEFSLQYSSTVIFFLTAYNTKCVAPYFYAISSIVFEVLERNCV